MKGEGPQAVMRPPEVPLDSRRRNLKRQDRGKERVKFGGGDNAKFSLLNGNNGCSVAKELRDDIVALVLLAKPLTYKKEEKRFYSLKQGGTRR
jgi:hypothetical protein